MYYMSVLMNQIGFDTVNANYMSLVGGGALLIGTIPAILLMEKFGRRFWAVSIPIVLVDAAQWLTPESASCFQDFSLDWSWLV